MTDCDSYIYCGDSHRSTMTVCDSYFYCDDSHHSLWHLLLMWVSHHSTMTDCDSYFYCETVVTVLWQTMTVTFTVRQSPQYYYRLWQLLLLWDSRHSTMTVCDSYFYCYDSHHSTLINYDSYFYCDVRFVTFTVTSDLLLLVWRQASQYYGRLWQLLLQWRHSHSTMADCGGSFYYSSLVNYAGTIEWTKLNRIGNK